MSVGCRFCLVLGGLLAAGAVHATEVAVCTDRGRAVIELADDAAPLHVANFLSYVDSGFYAGTVFHRAISGFVVQGGGVDRQLRPRATREPVENESRDGISNTRGTVAAARLDDPDTATAQFFVNLADNSQLDAGRDLGFTVFGRVKEGLAVFDEVSRLPTEAAGQFRADVPMPLVAIKSVARLDEAASAAFPVEGREAALKAAIAAASEDPAEGLRLIGHYRAICGADDPEISLQRGAHGARDRRTPPRRVRARGAECDHGSDASEPRGRGRALPRGAASRRRLPAVDVPDVTRRDHGDDGGDGRRTSARTRVHGRRRSVPDLPRDRDRRRRARRRGAEHGRQRAQPHGLGDGGNRGRVQREDSDLQRPGHGSSPNG